jgi:hypothetical protein
MVVDCWPILVLVPLLARLSLIVDPFPFDNLDLSLARRNVNDSPLIRRILQTQDSPHPTNCTPPAQGDTRKRSIASMMCVSK